MSLENDPSGGEETSADLDKQPQSYPLALPIQRLAAYLIDMLILAVLLTPVSSRMDFAQYIETGEALPLVAVVQFYVIGYLLFVLINGWLMMKYGQTIGKRYLKIAVSTADYRVPDFFKLVGWRYFSIWIFALVFAPLFIADVLMVFRKDRRCLHDIIAGTQVINIRGRD